MYSSTSECLYALLSLLFGVALLVKKDKALSPVGMLIFAIFFFIWTYKYLIPRYMTMFASSGFVQDLVALGLTCVVVLWSYRLANGILHVLLVALLAPLLYQFFGSIWHLEPISDWEQARLFVSLCISLCLSKILPEYVHTADQLVSILLGSFLISASLQSFLVDMTYWEGVETCLVSWNALECRPFYFSWIVTLCLTLVWSLYEVFYVSRRQQHSGDVPYRMLPHSV